MKPDDPGPGIGFLYRIDYGARGIKQPANEQPCHSPEMKGFYQRPYGHDGQPPGGDINQCVKPPRSLHPEDFHEDADRGQSPYDSEQTPSPGASQRNKTYRRIRGRDKYKYHHVIDLSQTQCSLFRNGEPVIQCARGIEQDHARTKDGKCHYVDGLDGMGRSPYQEYQPGHGKDETYEMSEPADRIPQFYQVTYQVTALRLPVRVAKTSQ